MMLAGLGFLVIGYMLALPGLSETSLTRFYSLPPIDGASASSLNVYILSAWSTFAVACLVVAAVAALWRSPGESSLVLMTLLLGLASLRSEEHTSELQSLMRISYDVFCLKKKNT